MNKEENTNAEKSPKIYRITLCSTFHNFENMNGMYEF